MVLSSEQNAHEMDAISSVYQAMAGYIYPYLTEFYMWQGSIHTIRMFWWQYITITSQNSSPAWVDHSRLAHRVIPFKSLSKHVKIINPLYFKHSVVFISPFSAALMKESCCSVVYLIKKCETMCIWLILPCLLFSTLHFPLLFSSCWSLRISCL